jgi:hypothetical protein
MFPAKTKRRYEMSAEKVSLNGEFAGYTGTEEYFKHLFGIVYTDGVQAVAEKYKAYWLIDAVASHQGKMKKEPFQLWTLNGVLTMSTDSDQPILVSQEIPFTDFPSGELKLYLCDGVLMLPSEY